jgi:putative ABC transport system permease protein
MSLLIGSMTIGFILSLLALGVFLSFRVFAFPDITAEGSITLGASVAATLLVAGFGPLVATMIGFVSGMIAGATTGILHTRFNINGLLAGILVMTSLYSINLHIMGKSNIRFSPKPLSRIRRRRLEHSSSVTRFTECLGLGRQHA